MDAAISQFDRYKLELQQLDQERSSWIDHWRDINDYFSPRRLRYLATERNKGGKKNDKIINNAGPIAARTVAAGLVAGITSPARPWKRLLAPYHLRNDYEVLDYLDMVNEIVDQEMIKSNIYAVLHEIYFNLALFGTAVMYIEETDTVDEGFRAYQWPIGQYFLACSHEGRPDTVYRKFSYTVAQLVGAFGIDACSKSVQEAYEKGNFHHWVEVTHAVTPRRERDPRKLSAKNMPFASVWFESSATGQSAGAPTGFLRELGFRERPFMAVRWSTVGEDVYGSNNPGMDGLGDAKALQYWERRKAQAIDGVVLPTMQMPASLRHQRVQMLPNETIPVPETSSQNQIKPVRETQPAAVTEARRVVYDHDQRIKETFFYDLFLMMQQRDDSPNGGKQPLTATEVNERHEEKMLQLGPVLERIHDELLDPMLNRIVQILARRGKLPPPPQQLRGTQLQVEYVSIMAQAQKMLGTAAVERFASFAGSLSAISKAPLRRVDWDVVIKKYADMLGVPVAFLLSDERVQQLMQQEADEAAQAKMLEAAQGAAQAAQAAAQAEPTDRNVLGMLLNSAGGAGGAL